MTFMSKPDSVPAVSVHKPAPMPMHDARALTEGGQLAQIDLDGQIYTLRITRAGKLILTK